jgi:hypothetical protein
VPSVSLRILPEDFSPGDPLPAVAVEFEKKALQIEVESKARSLVFNTGALDKPFTAIRDCLRGLVKTWGLDPDVQESLKSPVEPENFPGSWVTPRDFPKEALANRASATVAFRVLVDETGAPTDCATQRAFSAYDFEEITCRLVMERARFVPAKNASGQPVASYYTNRVRWTPPPGRGR